MKDCDRATVQDALSDAEEYLRNALDNLKTNKPAVPEANAFASVVEEYGTRPKSRMPTGNRSAHLPVPGRTDNEEEPGFSFAVFRVVIEPRAWGHYYISCLPWPPASSILPGQ